MSETSGCGFYPTSVVVVVKTVLYFIHVILCAGTETTRNVPADVSSYTIDGLKADSSYRVLISSLTGSREGSPSTLVIRTGTKLKLSNTHYCYCPACLSGEIWL